MANDEKNSINNGENKLKLVRNSKTGRIVTLPVVATMVALSIGVGCIAYVAVNNICTCMKKEKYSYDVSYDSYSDQIEDIIGVDLDTSLEENLNSLQMLREVIDGYQNSDSLITKADALTMLENQRGVLEEVSLGIAKKWCANEWGGAASDYKILLEGSTLPGWVVTNPQTGTHELPNGQINDFLDYISKLQGYSNDTIEKSDSSDKFVSLCDNIVKYSGMVAADLSESKSK